MSDAPVLRRHQELAVLVKSIYWDEERCAQELANREAQREAQTRPKLTGQMLSDARYRVAAKHSDADDMLTWNELLAQEINAPPLARRRLRGANECRDQVILRSEL
jgi:hypothetical protein